jgi:predicted nucleic acid-binding Zn finger protein
MVHIIPVGRNQAYSLSVQYFSCTDQFGRICNSTGVHEKLSVGSEVAKGRDRLEGVVIDGLDYINMYACPDGKGYGIFYWSKLAYGRIQWRFW